MKGILHELPGQTFAFKRMQSLWTPEEAVRFERELEYLTGKYSLQQVIDGYVYLTEAREGISRRTAITAVTLSPRWMKNTILSRKW